MTLEERLADLAEAIGVDVKELRKNRVAVSDNLEDLPQGGMLIQTGLGADGSDFTVWFDDGMP